MYLQTHPFFAGRIPGAFSRRLAWAMAVSLVAHVLLLWPSFTPTVRPMLHASLRPGPVSPAAAATVRSVVPPPADLPSSVTPVLPAPADRKIPRRHAKPVPDLRPLPSSVTASPALAIDPAEQSALVDAESLRSYRLALALGARRFYLYPPQAIESGLAGTAHVRIAFARNGLLGRVDLIRSSGHEALDREAREMLVRAAQATAMPEALREQAFSMDFPVEFSLPAR